MAIKKKELTPEKAELNRKDLQDFFSFLSVNDVYKSESGFSADKEAILKVFKITENERYIICKQNESEFSSEGRAPDRMKSEIVFLIRNGSKDASENFSGFFAEN